LQYLFEDYVLDIDRRELRKGDAVLSVEPQVFDVLAFLIRHRERVVSRDELLANVWDGRSISDSTFTSRINAARSAISDSGEDQRLVRTVPRRGYRFVGSVRELQAAMEMVAEGATSLPAPATSSGSHSSSQVIGTRTILMLCAGAAVVATAATLFFFPLWPGIDTLRSKTAPVQRFDASAVPLVTDEMRRTLAGYPGRPDAKALAISNDGWSVADGASDIETAQKEALRQGAARGKSVCRIYATGTDVVWSRDMLPLPAPGDLRAEPLQAPLIADDIPTLNSQTRRAIADGHMKSPNHKALALTTRGYFWVNNLPTRGEPARLAVERCTDLMQRPCLLLAVDGFLTIQIPKSRRIDRIFLPSTETEMSDADRERIGRIYQGDEWRALARGRQGSWHPVAAAPSVAAAIESALKSCAQADDTCRLYAIGNFRVADE
jgi:DNA-binding winged helix-turn-helix (wHTH) protein